MTYPSVVPLFAAGLYQRMETVADQDSTYDWAMLKFLIGASAPMEDMYEYARDSDDDDPGFSLLLDVTRCPSEALDWLATMAGVRQQLLKSASDDLKRSMIADIAGTKRGTPAALARAAQPYLIGSKTVMLVERDGSAYAFSVYTLKSETPESDWRDVFNYAVNPRGVSGPGYYSGDNAAVSQPDAFGFRATASGSGAFGFVYDAVSLGSRPPIVVGDEYTVSVDVLTVPAGRTVALKVDWKDTLGSYVDYMSAEPTPISVPGRMEIKGVAPSGAAGMTISIVTDGGAAAEAFDIDRLMINNGDQPRDGYADGDTPGWKWTGTAYDSSSEIIATSIVPDALLAAKPAGLVMTWLAIDGGTYAVLKADHTDYADIKSTYTDYLGIRTDPSL